MSCPTVVSRAIRIFHVLIIERAVERGHAHFGSRERFVGVVKRNLAIARARTIIIDGRLRLETKGPAAQC